MASQHDRDSSATMQGMRVAVLALEVDLDVPYEGRVSRAADLVRSQRGADLVVLPELWAHGAFAYETWPVSAEPLAGPAVTAISAAAAEIGAHVLAGSIIERSTDGLYNTAVLVNPAGGIAATYRKIHRFGFGEGEATSLQRGDRIVVHPVGDAVLGLATCYDLRFPEMFRALVDAGATVLVLPASWPDKRIEHWQLLIRARAIESQAYVVACNAVGTHAGYRLGGHSAIVDPWGTVLAEAGVGEEVLAVDIDPESVVKIRDSFPVLRDRVL
jgi:predicted amidohydrolase